MSPAASCAALQAALKEAKIDAMMKEREEQARASIASKRERRSVAKAVCRCEGVTGHNHALLVHWLCLIDLA